MSERQEPNSQLVGQLVKYGLAKIANAQGELQFSNHWKAAEIHQWLKQCLPEAFDYIDLLPEDLESTYPWQLLKTTRKHFELERNTPDGWDLLSAKAGKSKGWYESKLYFGTCSTTQTIYCNIMFIVLSVTRYPIETIVREISAGTSTPPSKLKGKGRAKRSLCESYLSILVLS